MARAAVAYIWGEYAIQLIRDCRSMDFVYEAARHAAREGLDVLGRAGEQS